MSTDPRKIWVGPVRREKRKTERKVRVLPAKKVYFVMVYNKNNITLNNYGKLQIFIDNLEQKGFQIEETSFSLDKDVIFLKIYVPQQVLLHFAEIFSLELAFHNTYLKLPAPKPYRFMSTVLTSPQINDPLYRRTRGSILGDRPKGLTSAERGLIIYKVLSHTSFGEEKEDFGIVKLLHKNIIEDAFPLHDGPFEWTKEGFINDRQLLTKFWSSLKCWYKQQPLDLVEKYYGPQTAFYFAWLGTYNKMLIFSSIVAVFCFIFGAIAFIPSFKHRIEEVCKSNVTLCPTCVVEHCKYSKLKGACTHAFMIHLFDNPLVVTFAALMSFFSTAFLEMWKRQEAVLKIRWNLQLVEVDYSMRPEFEDHTTYRRVSKITGATEPYMPRRVLCYRYAVTSTIIFLLIVLTLLVIVGIMVYTVTVTTVLTRISKDDIVSSNVAFIASSTGSCISVAFILTFQLVYRKIALWLTNMENPRTQVDFDNAYTYKSYALAFVSNYSVVFYIAFVKGRFYTYPGDKNMWTIFGGLRSELCDPAGCVIDLCIQMVFILLAKNLLLTVKQYIVPLLMVWLNKFKKHTTKRSYDLAQWENDYLLNHFNDDQLMDEFLDMVIQYGFVTFFVAACPLAPLLALLNNLLELRVDAFKFTCTYRRPVAIKVANIAAYNGILHAVTYMGVATNAFVIAFTSDMVQRTIYKSASGHLAGFVNSMLSVFDVRDFPDTFQSDANVSFCYYPGKRNPPEHKFKYQLKDEYWFELAMKFLTVVIFEHVVMVLSKIIAYAIPDIPYTVRQYVNGQKENIREMKLRALHEDYMKEQANAKSQ